ncbi:MAG: nucleoside-diphosphate-sugar epimerase [Acidimicrobiales bacterium]|nr:nucleoside-diphosphate-sugar epimerase [Acidimicrobiales bacterium]
MSDRVVITGGSGFVGQVLQAGLRAQGFEIDVFDRLRGRVVNTLRRRHLGTSRSATASAAARRIHTAQRRIEPALTRLGLLRPTWDDILDIRSALAERFRGSHAVIHLAGIAHPHAPGTAPQDFQRINYDGAVNVFEAARDAGVAKFVFASSAQVYRINDPFRIDEFPILESNYCPTVEDGQTAYGALKKAFEEYMTTASRTQPARTQSMAFRLEYPAFRSSTPNNLYVSTSIENLLDGFTRALRTTADFDSEVFNLCDAHVDSEIVDVQQYLASSWPDVPNHTAGNESLVSVAKARDLLDYRPVTDGTYFDSSVVW